MHLGELSVKFACLHGKRWHTFREKGDTLSPLGKNNVRKIVCLSPYSEYCVINDIPPQTNSILCCTNSIQYVPTLYPFTLGQYCLPKPPCNQVLLFIYLSAPINFFRGYSLNFIWVCDRFKSGDWTSLCLTSRP